MPSLLEAPAADQTIEIKGATYAVETIDPGFAGVAAVRLTKLVNGECYAVTIGLDSVAVCECPDFVCRHEGKGTHCKHIKAALAAGLLVAPISGGSPALAAPVVPVVAPITRKDLVRSSYFGIKLPVAPIVVEAPAVQSLPPAPPAPVEADDDDNHYGPAGDTWEGFEDLDRWELGPEAEPIEAPAPGIDLSRFAPSFTVVGDLVEVTPPATLDAIDAGFAELAVGFLTDSALDLVEDGRHDEALGLYDSLEPENRQAFDAFMVVIGRPGLTWLGWLNACQAGEPIRRSRFVLTPEMEMEYLGYELGNAGNENAQPPKGRSFPELVAFFTGLLQGQADLDAERQAWLDMLEDDRDRMELDVPYPELVEAGGVEFARSF